VRDRERRCLIIDAQPTTRLGVRGLLADRYAVEEAEDGRDGLAQLIALGGFDVAIVELARNATDADSPAGIDAIRALRDAQPGLGIVAHARRPERTVAAEAIDAGAAAFVAKSSPAGELARAVEAAAEAEVFVDPAAGARRELHGLSLTRRQREVLQLFADGHSTSDVARRLGLGTETIRTHTKAILARLGARDRAHAVATALRHGLID
jgi:DNA-binding NarL/FixJ family response regulator